MNNGPALVVRGALLGCVVVYMLVSLIQGGNTFQAALAAVELSDAQQLTAQAVDPNNPNGSLTTLPTAAPPTEEAAVPVVYDPLPAEGLSPDSPASPDESQKKEKKQKEETNQTTNSECGISTSYPPDIQQWCDLITNAAQQYDLPADLLAALILQESGGNAQAYSKSGAVGLMQVMPRDGIAAGFQCVNGPCFASRPTIAELEDPAYNIDYGTRYLAGLVEKRGSIREALFAYGPMNVGYTYADKVLGIYEAYRAD